MYRIKDPRKSLHFYTKVLGMTLLKKMDFPGAKFSLFFMGYEAPSDIPKDDQERTVWAMSRKATLELTQYSKTMMTCNLNYSWLCHLPYIFSNWGTENDAQQAYNIGNKDGIGYGHIGILVNDVIHACQRFEELGVEFIKRPDDGRMKGLAFIKDPDGYWIEIFSAKTVAANC